MLANVGDVKRVVQQLEAIKACAMVLGEMWSSSVANMGSLGPKFMIRKRVWPSIADSIQIRESRLNIELTKFVDPSKIKTF